MIESISDNLKNSLRRPTPVYKKTIYLYRLTWNGSAYAYADAIDITEYLTLGSSGFLLWKLDKENYGVFNLDNVTLTFRNERNQWKQDNSLGLFPSGTIINQSKIIVHIGAQLADGTYETAQTFVSYIAGDPDYNPEDKTISMTAVSGMSIFEKKNAEEISTLVPDELLGENSGTAFTTANDGVGVVVIVKRGVSLIAASEIFPSTDYAISNLNKTTSPLTVTLVSDLTSGEKLYCSYRYWYQDKTLEWIVEQVMILCGISSYSITPAVFSSSIENTWDFDDQSDWNTCTKENIETLTAAGSFKVGLIGFADSFASGETLDNWDERAIAPGGSWGVNNYNAGLNAQFVTGGAGTSVIRTASTRATGTWYMRPRDNQTTGDDMNIWFMATGEDGAKIPNSGYGVQFVRVGATSYIILRKKVGATYTNLITSTTAYSRFNLISVSLDSSGNFDLLIDGVSIGTANDTTHSSSEYMTISMYASSVATWMSVSDIYYYEEGTTLGTGILTSPEKGAISGLNSWGKVNAIYTANGATITIETSVWDGAAWDDWVEIDGTGQILSTAYATTNIKFRVTAAIASLTTPVTPVFNQITVLYYTSTTNIELVNMTGKTCKQILELVAEMPAYEIGFQADDTFVYRPRLTTIPSILDLKSDTNIKELRNLTEGVDRIYNRVVADFGIYEKVSDATGDTEPNSVTKYGTREYNVGSSNLLPAENVNMAYAVAPTILAYTKTPRRRCTIETQFILHLELGDVVTVYYDEPTALRRWKWGDKDVVYGQAELEYYNDDTLDERYNLWGVAMRVEGIELDFQNWQTNFDLVEVL